jgi:ubiquinone/menaquinone biosynthesis C-methylase UbiE
MGIMQYLTSQGIKARGVFGWIEVLIADPLLIQLLYGKVYREISRLLDLQPEDDVLDVACGTGIFLKKHASHVHLITGVDHSEVMIKVARRRNRDRVAAGTAEIVLGDSAALPWEDNRFSAVTTNCIGCFAEPQRSLQEMHRVLRPGGRAVIVFDNYNVPDEEKARKYEQKFEQTYGKWGMNIWNDIKVRKMMDNAGFPQESVSYDETLRGFTKAVKQ